MNMLTTLSGAPAEPIAVTTNSLPIVFVIGFLIATLGIFTAIFFGKDRFDRAVLLFITACAVFLVTFTMSMLIKQGDDIPTDNLAVEQPSVTPTPLYEEEVTELRDLLSEQFGVIVDTADLTRAVSLVREAGDVQQVMGTNKEGKRVVVSVFSTVDPDENTLSVSVAAG